MRVTINTTWGTEEVSASAVRWDGDESIYQVVVLVRAVLRALGYGESTIGKVLMSEDEAYDNFSKPHSFTPVPVETREEQ